MIKDIANEARMPITYGGGIKNCNDAIKIFNFGIEKISINSLYFENKNEVKKIINSVGSQSLVVTLDIKLDNNEYCVFTNRGKIKQNISLVNILKEIQQIKVGEVIINNIDKEGTMQGYDEKLLELVFKNTKIPITFVGGVGQESDLKNAIKKFGCIGFGCSSFFIYKGPRKAVLISYKNSFFRYFRKMLKKKLLTFMIKLNKSKKLSDFCNYLVLLFPISLVFSNLISELILGILIFSFLMKNSSISKLKSYINFFVKLFFIFFLFL